MFEYEIAVIYFFFKQKTAYEIRIRDWSSDVCSSDLPPPCRGRHRKKRPKTRHGKIWHAPCDGACNGQGTSGGFPPPSRKDEKRWNRKPPISSAARIPYSGFARAGAEFSADRTSVGQGQGVSVRVELGGGQDIKKKNSEERKWT